MTTERIESLVLKPVSQWYGTIVDIPIQLIRPDPENLRQEFDQEDLIDLGKNMETIGQLDEVTVFPIVLEDDSWAGFFDLHDGERRWRAATIVGLPTLRAKIIPRPSTDEILYKKISRVLQTRSLTPEKKVAGLERAFEQLGILGNREIWESYRERLGGGQEWPQLTRVLMLTPRVRRFMEEGLINFTIAQSIGRLPVEKQQQVAEFVVVNKINGRFFSTQMVPYILEHPDATPAQAFEHARVGGWQQYSRTPYQKGHEPPLDERVDSFLDACVKWERAWETVVHTGLVHGIEGNANYAYRIKDAARRIAERAQALAQRVGYQQDSDTPIPELPSPRAVAEIR